MKNQSFKSLSEALNYIKKGKLIRISNNANFLSGSVVLILKIRAKHNDRILADVYLSRRNEIKKQWTFSYFQNYLKVEE